MAGRNRQSRIGLGEAALLLAFAVLGVSGITILGLGWNPTETPRVSTTPAVRICGTLMASLFVILGLAMPVVARWRRSICDSLPGWISGTAADSAPATPADPADNFACPDCGVSLDARHRFSLGGATECRHCHRRWEFHLRKPGRLRRE